MSYLSPTQWSAALLLALPCVVAQGKEISFRNDVEAVISKAGCNLGTCHGNATGKGGFKMSLRGGDLNWDFAVLTEDARGRRINLFEPEHSLILEKATQALAHEGGKRFAKDSWEYHTLHDWIAQGAHRQIDNEAKLTKLEVTPHEQILIEPASQIQIKVVAHFSDGTQQDVTPHAVYELAQVGLAKVSKGGLVEKLKNGEPTLIVRYLDKQAPVSLAFVPARPGFEWQAQPENNFIDHQVFAKLKNLRTQPSVLCDDSTYVRRAYLDLLGEPPTSEEARAFVADAAPDKREQLVDRLLCRPEFADFWALKWADALRVESKTMDRRGMSLFHDWIREAVATNMPLDQFAHHILSAKGSTYKVPESNFYRAVREPNVRAEAIAQVFLGTRLKCAQCHNHPFDRWTQDDYFNWAAVFARIDYDVLENKRTDKNDKHEFVGEQIVKLTKTASLTNPHTGDPAEPKLLGSALLSAKTVDAMQDLDAAADWLASAQNSLFVQAQVNRIWSHLMGRGLVDPVDDFRATNPASHPALLKALSAELVKSGFDLRHMIRLIMASRAYQLSSVPNATNADDEVNYSHAIVRRLSAEQIYDSIHAFLGLRGEFSHFPECVRAAQLPGPVNGRKRDFDPKSGEAFLKQFGSPPRQLACECERTNEPAMPQAFQLISSPRLNDWLGRRDNVLALLMKDPMSYDKKVEELFWRALSHAPSSEERQRLAQAVRSTPSDQRRGAMEDVAWSLVNAKEFILRQ